MWLASASLLFMARHAAGGAAALLSVCCVPVCLGLILILACVLLPHRLRGQSDPSFDAAAIGTMSLAEDERSKEEPVAPARPRRRGKSPKRR